jgi:hypothetical protein
MIINVLMFRIPRLHTALSSNGMYLQKNYCKILTTSNTRCDSLQFLILAILATRMHLSLWQINQHVHGSDALVCIPMSDISPANSKVTTVTFRRVAYLALVVEWTCGQVRDKPNL